MSWLSSLRRRLRVRFVHGTSVGFREGDCLLINIPGHLTEEATRSLWEAVKSNFPNTRFQLITGRDLGVTVVQYAGGDGSGNAAKNADQQRSAEKGADLAAPGLAASPDAAGLHDIPSLLVWSVNVSPKPLGESFVQGVHSASSDLKFTSAATKPLACKAWRDTPPPSAMPMVQMRRVHLEDAIATLQRANSNATWNETQLDFYLDTADRFLKLCRRSSEAKASA